MAIKTRLISFIWGFCEATFFFLVPDIWLSRIVLKDKKEAIINIAITTLGALFGGCVMYYLATAYFEDIQNFLALIPGISSFAVEQTGKQIEGAGLLQSLLTGIASGIPYKIYASWSGYLGLHLGTFLLFSALIRTLRFTFVTGVAYMFGALLRPYVKAKSLHIIHASCWIIFYIMYFYKMGL